MKVLSVLCLTDHGKHSKENSVYAILREIQRHPFCSNVYVASRSNTKNKSFFEDMNFSAIHGIKVDESFDYDPLGKLFIENIEELKCDNFDIIFLRLPRPITDNFLTKLSGKFSDKVIINNPLGIIETSSKAFMLNVPDLCPPIKLCKSKAEIIRFCSERATVLKPLKEYGGKGIVRVINQKVSDGDEEYDLNTYLESVEDILVDEGLLAMKYLKNVTNGDKRLLVVDGEILAASLRMPAKDSWLCNVARGGLSVHSEPTSEEYLIAEKLAPELKSRGILVCGIDTLEDDDGKRVLSEINTLSIGGFPQAEKQTGRPIIKELVDKIFEYAS